MKKVIVITGPTASGKSQLAIDIAQEYAGIIINGDSMQLYQGLPILTACPPATAYQHAPHHLFEHLTATDEPASVGWWYHHVCHLIRETHKQNKLPIVVGGTGLYLKTLSHGLSTIPETHPDIRQHVRTLAQNPGFYEIVKQHDPETALSLHPHDTQRLSRVLEVFLQTGKTLTSFYRTPPSEPTFDLIMTALVPERDVVYHHIHQRLDTMLQQGVLEEVQKFMQHNPPPRFPLWKAVGLHPMITYLKGASTKDAMIMTTQQQTRRYAKRQYTWIRHQMSHYHMCQTAQDIQAHVRGRLPCC